MGSNSGQAQVDSGGSSTESLSLSGGLMFGQKIYFEDAGGGGSGSGKRVRGSGSGQMIPRCQVEGCRMDLSNAKGYYSRHRVCGMHSKSPKVIVGGLEQRFCQQCSRFHQLPEFDLEKRSCRRRLAGHNERRRKPQPASLLASRYGRIAPSHYRNAETVMSGNFLGDQQMGISSGRTSDIRVMRRPVSASSWQINSESHHHQPLNVFSQGTVTGDMMNPSKVNSYKELAESSCALSLLSNPHQSQNNNTWRSSSSFDPMTVTLAQPPPAHNQHQYLNPSWVFKTGETSSSPHDLSPVLGLGQISEPGHCQISRDSTMDGFELSHRREFMEAENTRTYDSSSSSQHGNWSL